MKELRCQTDNLSECILKLDLKVVGTFFYKQWCFIIKKRIWAIYLPIIFGSSRSIMSVEHRALTAWCFVMSSHNNLVLLHGMPENLEQYFWIECERKLALYRYFSPNMELFQVFTFTKIWNKQMSDRTIWSLYLTTILRRIH